MISQLSATNFKSWPSIRELRLDRITGLFGGNSSGKTSILQILLLLKQTVESTDRAQVLNFADDRSLTSLGSFRDVIYTHDLSKVLRLGLSWQPPHRLRIPDPFQARKTLFAADSMSFATQISADTKGIARVDTLGYHLDGNGFTMRAKPGTPSKYTLEADAGSFRFVRTRGRKWDLPAPVKCYGFPDQVKAYYQNAGFLADVELALEDLLTKTYYLGPLREFPQRQYTWSGAQPEDVGRRGERVVDALLASRARGYPISRGKGKPRLSLEEYVAYWLKQLGMIDSFEVRPITPTSNIYQVWLRQVPETPEVLITDVGFGVSQILPVIVLCYYVPEGSVLIFEQPEIHLHPSVQAGLADVFIDAMKVRGIQILFESHSEHLLRRLQRRIAEEELSTEAAALYFTRRRAKTTSITELELDLYGNITNWPEEFFGEPISDSVAMLEAEMRRRQAG